MRGFTQEDIIPQLAKREQYEPLLTDLSTPIPIPPSSPTTVQGPFSPSSATETAPPALQLEMAPPVTPAKAGLPSSPPPLKPKRKPIPADLRMKNLRERQVKSKELLMSEVDELIEEVAKEATEEVLMSKVDPLVDELIEEVAKEATKEVAMETTAKMDAEAREVFAQEDWPGLEEAEETSWTKAKPYGSMAKTTFNDYKTEIKEILSSYSLREQMELTMLLAAGFSLPSLACPLLLSKLRLTVTTDYLADFLRST